MTAIAETTYPRAGLPRLARIELRKMADTRAGFWLLLVVALMGAAIVTITLLAGEAKDQDLHSLFQGALWTVSILLPVLGILAVTSEWTQRTGLTTFALVPERERVVAAKVMAAVALGVAAVVASLVAATVGNLLAGGSWDLPTWLLGQGTLFEVLAMLGGVAFGLAFMNSALAIVLYYLLPTVWAILGETVHALDKPANWLDTSRTLEPVLDGRMTGTEWAQLGTSLGVWIGLVLLIGLWRLRRTELK
jgi:ABC-2 type transport system permease protein